MTRLVGNALESMPEEDAQALLARVMNEIPLGVSPVSRSISPTAACSWPRMSPAT